jgi:hypothetical protein
MLHRICIDTDIKVTAKELLEIMCMQIRHKYVRFEAFTAVIEEWCLLGCYAMWLL